MSKKKITIATLSDLHGILPPVEVMPAVDLVLIGGDICGHHDIVNQARWLGGPFKRWLEALPCNKVVGVAGNHDFIWQKAPYLVPDLPWIYLEDQGTEFEGYKIWGSPWQKRFFDWAFNLDEPELARKWSFIPDDSDILVLHGPVQGYGDWVPRDENVGSPSLLKKVREIKPRLVVYGHIHLGYGVYEDGGVTLANVSIVNEKYDWTNLPTVFTLDPEEKKTTAVSRGLEEPMNRAEYQFRDFHSPELRKEVVKTINW